MKILFVASGLGYGGTETQLIALIDELRRRGETPALYLLTQHAPRREEVESLGVPVVVDDKRSRLDIGLLRRLRRHIRAARPDVVHGFLFDGNLYSRLAGAGLGIPILNSERNDAYRLRAAQWLSHWPTRWLADGVVANSHAGCRHAQRLFGFDDAHMHVVWNGVRLPLIDRRLQAAGSDWRRALFGEGDVRVATLVGSITERKDHELAIQVAEHLLALDSRWRVVFVGASYDHGLSYANAVSRDSMTHEERVRVRHEASAAREAIHFMGQRADALELIAGADVLFSTSRHEGFPNVVLEAMAAGTPVVSTDYSDIRRILPHEWQVVAERSPAALARAITRAREERSALAQTQRAWVEANATIERSAQALLEAYGHYVRAAEATPSSARQASAR